MANIFQYSKLKFQQLINADGSAERPVILLCNRKLETISEILYDSDTLDINPLFNDVNTISFTCHKMIDGNLNNNWDKIKDLAIILVKGFGYFEIETPKTETDSVVKKIVGKALQEVELGQCNCTLEINTDDDIARADYDSDYPTLFYRTDGHTEASLLHRVLTYAPHYSIGHVDSSLMNLSREYSCEDTAVWDFLNQTVAEDVGCVFICDPFSRTINAYDLSEHCLYCGGRHIFNGVCQDCNGIDIENGYGLDTPIYIDSENLAEELDLSGDKDSVKNCYKVTGGDDVINNLIGERIIGGNNYIWTFSDDMLSDMSTELQTKYAEYVEAVEGEQSTYDEKWDEYNNYTNLITNIESVMAPSSDDGADTTAEAVYNDIFEKLTYCCLTSTSMTLSSLSRSILNYAKVLIPSTYGVKWYTDSNGDDMTSCGKSDGVIVSWSGCFYVYEKDNTDDDGNDINYYPTTPTYKSITVKDCSTTTDASEKYTNEYYLWLKQQLDLAMAKNAETYQAKYDTDYTTLDTTDSAYYKNFFGGRCHSCGGHHIHYAKVDGEYVYQCADCDSTDVQVGYGITRLTSFKDAYALCTSAIYKLDSSITDGSVYSYISSSGTAADLYGDLKAKYDAFVSFIEDQISYLDGIDSTWKTERDAVSSEIATINNNLNMESYLGTDLYSELVSYKREQVYKNDNFSSEDTDDEATLMSWVEELILDAKQDIAKSCEVQYELTGTFNNFMQNIAFKDFYDSCAVGNFIRIRVDDILYKLRLISIDFKWSSDNSNIALTFSDVTRKDSRYKSIQETLAQAQSMATSYSYVESQTTSNDKQITQIGSLILDGLDATNTMIQNNDNQEITIDTYGILARKYDDTTEVYDDCQLRIDDCTIAMTDDNWSTIKSAFGKIYYNGEWRYGIITDAVVGNLVATDKLQIQSEDGSVIITKDGITLDGGSITWSSKIDSGTIDGLNETLGVTKITSDSVISPKINGGYLSITNSSYGSVTIDPNNSLNNEYMFSIKDKNSNVLLGVDFSGNATFSGTLNGTSGSFKSLYLNGFSDGIAMGSSSGVPYISIGTSGYMIMPNLYVNDSASFSCAITSVGESHFSYGTYSDPLYGTSCALKCSGGFAADIIYVGGENISTKISDVDSKADKISTLVTTLSGKIYSTVTANISDSSPTYSFSLSNGQVYLFQQRVSGATWIVTHDYATKIGADVNSVYSMVLSVTSGICTVSKGNGYDVFDYKRLI